jgi:hypothetical protein
MPRFAGIPLLGVSPYSTTITIVADLQLVGVSLPRRVLA